MPTIYLADRDEPYRKGLAHALRRRGLEVEEFASGSELYARSQADAPDLVVMDTDLEEMDGFQVFALFQRERPERPLPIVFVTAFDHPRVARVCKQRGALGYVGKGRPLEQVVGAIQGFVSDDTDPLYGRRLPAALAWLQSRGRSGRLDVEADGERGYVLLHRGKVLEARWSSFQGEEALAMFSEALPEARFRFAEGADEIEAPQPETAAAASGARAGAPALPRGQALPSEWERERRGDADADEGLARDWEAELDRALARNATAETRPGAVAPVPASAAPPSTSGPAEVSAEAAAAPPPRPSPPGPSASQPPSSALLPGGALAAALELSQQERLRRRHGWTGRRAGLGVAAALALLLSVAVALIALSPGSIPPALAGILDGLGLAEADLEVAEPVSQFARSPAGGGDLALVERDSPDPSAAEGGGSAPETPAGDRAGLEPEAAEAPAATVDAPPGEAVEGTAEGAEAALDPEATALAAGPPVAEEEQPREEEQAVEEAQPGAEAPATEAEAAAAVPAEPSSEPGAEPAERRSLGRLVEQSAPVTPPARETPATPERRAPPPPATAPGEAQADATPDPEGEGAAAELRTQPAQEPPPAPRRVATPERERRVAAAPGRRTAPAGAAGEGLTGRRVTPAAAAAAAPEETIQRPVLLQRGTEPYYPAELKAQGVGGSVILNIRVGANGRAQQVEVRRSSGYEAFDQAAVAAVGTFLWEPARTAEGPTEAWVTQAVTFRP